jgi:hypothetical protein
MHDETLSVVSVRIGDEDCLSAKIDRCNTAPTPTGFAEIVGDYFPILHAARILSLLRSTRQRQNDMKERDESDPSKSIAMIPFFKGEL